MAINLEDYVYDVPDFPKKGIIFKDITPIFENETAFRTAIDKMASFLDFINYDKIVCADARGFIIGSVLAYKLNKGLVLARKKGKLPRPGASQSYALEYGDNTLVISKGSIMPGDRVVIADDLLATGGSAEAILKICRESGAEVKKAIFLIELDPLKGADRLRNQDCPVESLIHYDCY